MTGPIRVLHLIKSLGRGGAEMLLPETLRFHDNRNFTWLYGYFLPWKDQVAEPLRSLGVEVVCFSAKNNVAILFRVPRLVRFLRDNKIDIVHCHLPWAGIAGRLAGKWAGVHVVYTEHNKLERYHFLTRCMNLLTLGWNDRVIAVSGEVQDSIHRFRRSTPVVTIYNGVDTGKFMPQCSNVRKELGIDECAVVVGNVCVFRKQKRLQAWIEVAGALSRVNDDVHFLLVGDGPERVGVLQRIEALNLKSRLHWVGLQQEVRPYLAAMDVVMLTSEFEGLPVALLEAMAMEKAIVATAAGGIPEVIDDGISGLLVPVDRPADCYDRVKDLLDNRTKIRILAVAARNRAVGDFSIQAMVNKLEKLYKEMPRR